MVYQLDSNATPVQLQDMPTPPLVGVIMGSKNDSEHLAPAYQLLDQFGIPFESRVVSAKTLVPVLGVPVPATALNGVDALLSIVQMPRGVPVGTLAIGAAGAVN